VIPIKYKKILLIAAAILISLAAAWAGYSAIHRMTPVRIGVLLPLTGDVELKEPLEWAKDNINRQGGIGGRQVELVYRDTSTGDTMAQAQELLSDDSIRIVIGPETSDEVFALAPLFIEQKKLLISPMATSGDIFRAFGRKGCFWRTSQGDVAQVKTIIGILQEKGTKRAALLAENTTYGKTFYDWTGFFATEYGIALSPVRTFDSGSSTLDRDVDAALATDPDYIIAACGPSDAAEISRAIARSGTRTKLFLTDSAAQPALVRTLGPAADGLEGTNPTADPSTGFSAAYEDTFGHAPADYAAPTYDALLLAAYTSARQDASPFESPADSIRKVVYGNGTARIWSPQESHEAITDILAGRLPSVSGASGPLDYDADFGVDPLVTWYSHWIVQDGKFDTVATVSSARTGTAAGSRESVARSGASSSLMSALGADGTVLPATGRTDLRAVIVGPSQGWKNYRHQADALTVYTLLRANGVADDHIILMTYDDIPTLPENPLRGDIHNIPRGANIRVGAAIDYTGANVTAATLKSVLAGRATAAAPVVLESNESTDVLVYIASHGTPGGITFPGNDSFTTADFTGTTDAMYRDHKYRQLVFIVDTCFGESIAGNATAPGILYLTGAAGNEPSLGAVYDMDIRQWLSDEFTSGVLGILTSNPTITFRELYIAAYDQVTGSHVRMVTTGNISLDEPVQDFFRP
jgi:ABC-type branched-subunit amino acid transport system substrate-binding protein/glycosylphosphatidylinositol transamidase (GPIT) subunit GPI8